MINVPLQLGLRDLDIEKHNVTAGDDYAYNRMRTMMIRLIDVVNAIDPSLHSYNELFRNYDKETVFQNDKFLIQYDGLRDGNKMHDNHWRLIWRNFVIQWYKHPKRALETNRELSHAEEAFLVAEFKEAMQGFVVYKPLAQRDAEQETQRMRRLNESLARNSISGAMMKPRSISGGIYELPDSPLLNHQRFGRYSADPDKAIPQGTLTEFMAGMAEERQKIKNMIDKLPGAVGPHRMTQGQYGDYAAAAQGSPDTLAIWERIKAEGIQIITEEERTPADKLGIGDLSICFMYPHTIEALDLSKFEGDKGMVGLGQSVAEIRPKGNRISEEGHQYDYNAARQFFEDMAKKIPPAYRPQHVTEISPEALANFERRNDIVDRVIKGEQLSLADILDATGAKHVVHQSPEMKALMADIDPSPPIYEETLRAYGLVRKDAGTAPQYFVKGVFGRTTPKTIPMALKVAFYLHYQLKKDIHD